MRIATWNLEWAGPQRQRAARSVIEARTPDVVVTTEDVVRPWPSFPHTVDGGNDWGYRTAPDRRKVMAWSRTPWRTADVETPGATRGRLVVASTSVGVDVTVVAVCIPWSAAHVSSGRRDRRRWDENLEFCEVLGGVLAELRVSGPVVVVGDFNQRVPRRGQPVHVWEALEAALDGFAIATGGDRAGRALIDHVAHDGSITATEVDSWPEIVDGRRLSDHAGVCVGLELPGR